MPCNADYMEPTNYEKNVSEVKALLEEIKTGTLPKWYNTGYVNGDYASGDLDELTSELCGLLQKIEGHGAPLTNYSLELQMWWRDHKIADSKRLREELEIERKRSDIQKALTKLTDYERKLLGYE